LQSQQDDQSKATTVDVPQMEYMSIISFYTRFGERSSALVVARSEITDNVPEPAAATILFVQHGWLGGMGNSSSKWHI
jgi:hypothetical protein